ncbi:MULTISPECIES: GNAT family N-acetyltransferase [Bacillaceae]|uniref:GNAT family N-acetyltransferase n=1 Tax=Bacillaceae TaxID=186817 RepID=UPI000BFC9598|nr:MULTISPECIES: GNAT family N-acetyltransferase [Bacillaceae]PGT79243.1 GNAT family N-acetyltransferase [Bacillus sp. AFS040349]UGB30330.1 GNAT family N-acetyltransferase [Metabacillus sp. B2-18]
MNILKVTLNELDQVSQLFNQYRMFYGQASNLEGAKEFIKERIENNESVIFLAMENSSPAGFVQLYPIFTSVGMNRKWLLNDLFVAEEHRRHGVGKALMNKAKDLAVETKAAGILLETTKDNVKAQALYESLGYEKEDAVYFYNLSI